MVPRVGIHTAGNQTWLSDPRVTRQKFVRQLCAFADLVNLPAWEVLFPDGETVRNIYGVYYRDLALEVSES
jgi:hypothetical protein